MRVHPELVEGQVMYPSLMLTPPHWNKTSVSSPPPPYGKDCASLRSGMPVITAPYSQQSPKSQLIKASPQPFPEGEGEEKAPSPVPLGKGWGKAPNSRPF